MGETWRWRRRSAICRGSQASMSVMYGGTGGVGGQPRETVLWGGGNLLANNQGPNMHVFPDPEFAIVQTVWDPNPLSVLEETNNNSPLTIKAIYLPKRTERPLRSAEGWGRRGRGRRIGRGTPPAAGTAPPAPHTGAHGRAAAGAPLGSVSLV